LLTIHQPSADRRASARLITNHRISRRIGRPSAGNSIWWWHIGSGCRHWFNQRLLRLGSLAPFLREAGAKQKASSVSRHRTDWWRRVL